MLSSRRLWVNKIRHFSIKSRILDSVHGGQEVQYYLDKFRQNTTPAFAVIKVGGEVVEDELDILSGTCATLQNAGLKPVVIHGGGPQMNKELAKAGVEPRYIRGSRVTDSDTLAIAQRVFTGLNQRVVDSIKSQGVDAVGFTSGVFQAKISDPALMFVGDVTNVHTDHILSALRENKIPVLTSLGETTDGQVLNINADVAARDLVIKIKPMRVLFASAKGGWIDDDTKRIVNAIDLANDYERLAGLDYNGRQGTLLKLNEIKYILDAVPDSTSVAITSAKNMLKELFSHSGAGTIFFRGEKVSHISGAAMNAKLLTPAPHNAQVESTFVYGTDTNTATGMASVSHHPKLGKGLPPVLDQFKIAKSVQGLGREEVMWKAIQGKYPSLAWTWKAKDVQSGSNADICNILPVSTAVADGTLFDKATQQYVAWYNQGHPLAGWTADNARRLFEDPGPIIRPVSFTSSGSRKYKVGLMGARGYVGKEFTKLLVNHPEMELTVASSRALRGQRVIDCFGLPPAAVKGVSESLVFESLEADDIKKHKASQEVDIWVLALPNGLAPRFVPTLENLSKRSVMIDLGADYRFDQKWVYGLPERKNAREALRGATKISNPGCYATGTQVGLMPLLEPLSDSSIMANTAVTPNVFGVSGYSGAGTNPSDKNDPEVLKDNLLAYTLVNHMHERECSFHLGQQIAFMPHVASFFQGIHLTLSCGLQKVNGAYPTAPQIFEEFQRYYKGEPLIEVLPAGKIPEVKDVMLGTNVRVGGFTVDPNTGRLAFVSTIDNLMKGAASQAMQNLNIALGMDELTGLDRK